MGTWERIGARGRVGGEGSREGGEHRGGRPGGGKISCPHARLSSPGPPRRVAG